MMLRPHMQISPSPFSSGSENLDQDPETGFQKCTTKRELSRNYEEFLANVSKISEAARTAKEVVQTLEELSNTIKSKAMKDTAPGPDGIPYSVYNKLWDQAGPLKPTRLRLCPVEM